MGSELRTERVERHEGAEIRDVGFRVEFRGGELGGVEPYGVGILDGVTEQIGGGSGQWRVQICRHWRNVMMLEQTPEKGFYLLLCNC